MVVALNVDHIVVDWAFTHGLHLNFLNHFMIIGSGYLLRPGTPLDLI